MGQEKLHRSRLHRILLVIILVTLPCYLLGLIILWIGNVARDARAATPTATYTETLPPASQATATPLVPTLLFPTPTTSLTPTITATYTVTATYAIPTSTPTFTPQPSATPTATVTESPTATETILPTP